MIQSIPTQLLSSAPAEAAAAPKGTAPAAGEFAAVLKTTAGSETGSAEAAPPVLPATPQAAATAVDEAMAAAQVLLAAQAAPAEGEGEATLFEAALPGTDNKEENPADENTGVEAAAAAWLPQMLNVAPAQNAIPTRPPAEAAADPAGAQPPAALPAEPAAQAALEATGLTSPTGDDGAADAQPAAAVRQTAPQAAPLAAPQTAPQAAVQTGAPETAGEKPPAAGTTHAPQTTTQAASQAASQTAPQTAPQDAGKAATQPSAQPAAHKAQDGGAIQADASAPNPTPEKPAATSQPVARTESTAPQPAAGQAAQAAAPTARSTGLKGSGLQNSGQDAYVDRLLQADLNTAAATSHATGAAPAGNLFDAAKVDSQALVRQVRTGIEAGLQDGKTSVRLHLSPEDLGGIDLRVTAGPQGASVLIRAENPATGRLLEQNLGNLRAALQEAGVQLNGLAVDQQASQNGQFSSQQYPAQRMPAASRSASNAAAGEPGDAVRPRTFGAPSQVNYLV